MTMTKALKLKDSRRGRASTLTMGVVALVKVHFPTCMWQETFCNLIGVPRRTFSSWLRRGLQEHTAREKGKEPGEEELLYIALYEAVLAARAEYEAKNIAAIQAAASESWQAAAWLLERRYPQRWSRDRAEIAELHKRIAQLEKQLASTKG